VLIGAERVRYQSAPRKLPGAPARCPRRICASAASRRDSDRRTAHQRALRQRARPAGAPRAAPGGIHNLSEGSSLRASAAAAQRPATNGEATPGGAHDTTGHRGGGAGRLIAAADLSARALIITGPSGPAALIGASAAETPGPSAPAPGSIRQSTGRTRARCLRARFQKTGGAIRTPGGWRLHRADAVGIAGHLRASPRTHGLVPDNRLLSGVRKPAGGRTIPLPHRCRVQGKEAFAGMASERERRARPLRTAAVRRFDLLD